MTAQSIGALDQVTNALAPLPPSPKSNWLGRAVAYVKPHYLYGIALAVVAVWVIARLCTSKTVRPTSPPVTPPVSVGLTTIPPGLGSLIGRDKKHHFDGTLLTWEGVLIQPAPDDFYLAFNCGNPYKPLYLPSTLFKTAKEGDIVKFILGGERYVWKLDNKAQTNTRFEELFAHYQKQAESYAPGRGSPNTYYFVENWPENSVRINRYPLSAQARKWDSNTKTMEPLQESDCRAMEEGLKSPLDFDTLSRDKSSMLLSCSRPGAKISLVADVGVIFLSVFFEAVKGSDEDETADVSEITISNVFTINPLIDPTTVQIARVRGAIKISYQPLQSK